MLSSLFTHTPTTWFYTLSLHDALPICPTRRPTPATSLALQASRSPSCARSMTIWRRPASLHSPTSPGNSCQPGRSEEHTSELQSRGQLVCRLMLEKKKEPVKHRQHSTQ